MRWWASLAIVGLLLVGFLALAWLARGGLGRKEGPGRITGSEVPAAVVAARREVQQAAAQAVGAPDEKTILFGDFHAHTSVSLDAFVSSLPLAGGEGTHPQADACDFARYCSALDFWSINDHAENLTPRIWRDTLDSIRACNAVAGDEQDPDVVAFLGWEWTNIGYTPDDHWGHRNVVLRHLDDDRIPARPIGASPTRSSDLLDRFSLPALTAMIVTTRDRRTSDLARYLAEWRAAPRCPAGVPVRNLPRDCMETAATPGALQAKLREWGHEAIVIPHGTAWGVYTPVGASWEKQLSISQHDPELQTMLEVYSGHGNSEEYRSWRGAVRQADGSWICPGPTADYNPACWRAGQIIERRCLDQGGEAADCSGRAAHARESYLGATEMFRETVVPLASQDEWLDAGQCRDCFLPAWKLRPMSSAQFILALTNFEDAANPQRFRFAFMGSSDVHTARPGTGYKEYDRPWMADFQQQAPADAEPWELKGPLPARALDASEAHFPAFDGPRDDRQFGFYFTGGLIAAHSTGRSRDAIWSALDRREVYATSGQRTLLWFDLLNAPDGEVPMGSIIRMAEPPRFRVRAAGAFQQLPGCPESTHDGLAADRIASLCHGQCYHPSDRRKQVRRIEVARIRPQMRPGEPVDGLIEDPWQIFECPPDPAGCSLEFADPEFVEAGRDAVYYVRAIEEPSDAVNGDPLRCRYNDLGECVAIDPTPRGPGDDRLAPVEERAWSSPIFVDIASSS